MTSPSSHAVLSPSSAHRWLACPASVGLVATMPERAEETSAYAREGTLAHEAAEKNAAFFFGQLPKDELTRWLDAFAPEVGARAEMLEHAHAWARVLARFEGDMGGAQVLLEQRFETGVPGCWGTADAVLVSGDTVHVCDFKYGQGVKVSAAGNPHARVHKLYEGYARAAFTSADRYVVERVDGSTPQQRAMALVRHDEIGEAGVTGIGETVA